MIHKEQVMSMDRKIFDFTKIFEINHEGFTCLSADRKVFADSINGSSMLIDKQRIEKGNIKLPIYLKRRFQEFGIAFWVFPGMDIFYWKAIGNQGQMPSAEQGVSCF